MDKKWQYCVPPTFLNLNIREQLIELLNQFGEDGWEFVGMIGGFMVFKKEDEEG